jgi:hypothetical protein
MTLNMKKNKSLLVNTCLLLGLLTNPIHAEPYLLHTSGSMVLDKATGLVWMRCTLGETWDGKTCVGEKRGVTFSEAVQTAKSLNETGGFGGYTDWAVPKIRQLHSLVDCFDEAQLRVIRTPQIIDGSLSEDRLQQYCANVQNASIHIIAFPLTSSGPPYWSSSCDISHTKVNWVVSFYSGYVGSSSQLAAYYVRLVRLSQFLSNEAAAGFSQQLPSGIEIFQANKKSKP